MSAKPLGDGRSAPTGQHLDPRAGGGIDGHSGIVPAAAQREVVEPARSGPDVPAARWSAGSAPRCLALRRSQGPAAAGPTPIDRHVRWHPFLNHTHNDLISSYIQIRASRSPVIRDRIIPAYRTANAATSSAAPEGPGACRHRPVSAPARTTDRTAQGRGGRNLSGRQGILRRTEHRLHCLMPESCGPHFCRRPIDRGRFRDHVPGHTQPHRHRSHRLPWQEAIAA